MAVFFLFLLALAAGTLSTLFWIPEDDMGRGYFQMNALVALSLLGLAAATATLHPFMPFGDLRLPGAGGLTLALAGGLLYWAAIYRERWRWARAAAATSLAGALTALLVSGVATVRQDILLPHRSWLLAAALASSAVFLGWSLVTMLLGHWYLIAPRLSFHHLTLFCRVLLGSTVVRCAAVAATLLVAASVPGAVSPHPLSAVSSFAAQGMFFWFRVLWGLVGSLVLALMALHCARTRSNQSATGILYVLVVGAFVGEITALYVTLTTGVPI
jgi:hypothetical protein